jgi:hypothetical protein
MRRLSISSHIAWFVLSTARTKDLAKPSQAKRSSKPSRRGRESSRSEIPSRGEKAGGFATNKDAETGFAPVLAAFFGFIAEFLGPANVLGSAFSGFAFLVAVTGGSLDAFVTGWWLGL